MNRYFTILWVSLLLLFACKSKQQAVTPNLQSGKRPQWVEQRPVNTAAYVGIGRASKINNPADYLQIAKKEALQDMVGEIKVTVSTNSILSQYQNNSNFNQQFFSDTRLAAQEFLENFTVVDSWENKTEYWIYYTLSKAEYEAQKRKKIYIASQQALSLMYKADKMEIKEDYVSIFKLRVKALALLQNYLNESVEVDYYGKQVYQVNTLLSQLQDQLFMIRLEAIPTQLKTSVGKPFDKPIEALVFLHNQDSIPTPLAYIPLSAKAEPKEINGNLKAESNATGHALFSISRVQSKEPIQILSIRPDLERLALADSLNTSLKTLIYRLETPNAQVRIKVEPLRIFLVSEETNQGKKLNFAILEPYLKKQLSEKGCVFVSALDQADYKIEIIASTKDLGAIWGTMQQATLDMDLIVADAKSKVEVLHENLSGIQGFQNDKEKAGLEAYKNSLTSFSGKIMPKLDQALFLD